jgi:hypothetical protein
LGELKHIPLDSQFLQCIKQHVDLLFLRDTGYNVTDARIQVQAHSGGEEESISTDPCGRSGKIGAR